MADPLSITASVPGVATAFIQSATVLVDVVYLAPSEERAVIEFILQMSALGHPVRINHLPFNAFSASRHRPAQDGSSRPHVILSHAWEVMVSVLKFSIKQ